MLATSYAIYSKEADPLTGREYCELRVYERDSTRKEAEAEAELLESIGKVAEVVRVARYSECTKKIGSSLAPLPKQRVTRTPPCLPRGIELQ